MILGVLAVGKSCVAIPKLHNHVLAPDSSSFSLSSNMPLLAPSAFGWAPDAKGNVNSTPGRENNVFLKRTTSLDVSQSHLLRRTCFRPHQLH